MNIWGIGPLLAMVGGVAASVLLVLQRTFGLALPVPDSCLKAAQLFGWCWGGIGLWFWIESVVLVVQGHRSRKLVTTGVYRYSRNPLYAAFIVFLIPAISLMMGDLLVLLVPAVMFVAFKILVRKEEVCLRREFGGEYERYTKRVAQLIPFVKI